MRPYFIFCLFSVFFLPSLASISPFDEFLSFLNPPKLPKEIDFESTFVKEARKKVGKIKEYFEGEFNSLSDKFKNTQDESVRSEKRIVESKVLLLLEHARALLSKSLPRTLVKYEFSEIICDVLDPYLEDMKSRSIIKDNWYSELNRACNEILEVEVSLPFVLPLEFKELLKLLDTAKAGEELKKNVIERIECAFLARIKWSDDALQGIGNQDEIIELKDTILEKYPKVLYNFDQRIIDRSLWFAHLRDTIKVSEADSSDDDFRKFSLDFMEFFLYRYLSKKDEGFLIDLFFTSPHKNDLLDVGRRKPLAESRLFATYFNYKYKGRERRINWHLEDNWRNKYPNLEGDGEKVMMEKFFPKIQEAPLEEPSGNSGRILASYFR